MKLIDGCIATYQEAIEEGEAILRPELSQRRAIARVLRHVAGEVMLATEKDPGLSAHGAAKLILSGTHWAVDQQGEE